MCLTYDQKREVTSGSAARSECVPPAPLASYLSSNSRTGALLISRGDHRRTTSPRASAASLVSNRDHHTPFLLIGQVSTVQPPLPSFVAKNFVPVFSHLSRRRSSSPRGDVPHDCSARRDGTIGEFLIRKLRFIADVVCRTADYHRKSYIVFHRGSPRSPVPF